MYKHVNTNEDLAKEHEANGDVGKHIENGWTVSYIEENAARKTGVVLVYLNAWRLRGHARECVAMLPYNGNHIRSGNELWVRAQLEKYKINIIKEVEFD